MIWLFTPKLTQDRRHGRPKINKEIMCRKFRSKDYLNMRRLLAMLLGLAREDVVHKATNAAEPSEANSNISLTHTQKEQNTNNLQISVPTPPPKKKKKKKTWTVKRRGKKRGRLNLSQILSLASKN